MTSSPAILCESLGPPARQWRPLSPRTWTCVGVLAIPLWATWPALALRALEMPAFECLTIAFLFGWIALGCTQRTATTVASKHSRRLSWVPAIACALGLCGSNAFHILATHYIPAAEANLISYLWPVMIVGIGATLRLFRLRPRQVVGLSLGFAGAVILMGGGAMALSPEGIALALLSGVSWALYCIFRLKWKAVAGPVPHSRLRSIDGPMLSSAPPVGVDGHTKRRRHRRSGGRRNRSARLWEPSLGRGFSPWRQPPAGGHGVRDTPLQRVATGRIGARVAHLDLRSGCARDRCRRAAIAQ